MAIHDELTTIRNRALQQFAEIAEFRAFTTLSYKFATEYVEALADGVELRIPFSTLAPGVGLADKQLTERELPQVFQLCEANFLGHVSLQVQVAQFEYFLFDMLRAVLTDDPRRLPANKKLDYSAVISASTRDDIVREMVDRELNELKYQTPEKWFAYLENLVGDTLPSPEQITTLTEAKATRDLLVHNNAVVNGIYVRKAGASARGNIGDVIPIDGLYVYEVWQTTVAVIHRISTALLEKLGDQHV